MGVFSIDCGVQNLSRTKNQRIPRIMVDTGSEATWIPRPVLESLGVAREKRDVAFRMANGQVVTRNVGFAVIHVGKDFTVDEVVFADKEDCVLLGARTLEGLNLMVHPREKKLVAAGPRVAASARKIRAR